MLEHSTIVAH